MAFLTALKQYFLRHRQSQIHSRAAVLAYHTLLSIIPVVGLIFWYLNYIGVSSAWFNLIRVFLLTQLNIDPDNRLIQVFDRLTRPTDGHSWGWLSVALVSYTTWNLMNLLGESLDSILKTSPEQHLIEKRGWIRLALRRFIVFLIFPISVAVSLVLTQWIRKDSLLRHVLGIDTVGPILALPLVWAVDIVALFLIYYFIPRTHISLNQAFKAACFAGPAAEILRYLFGIYSKYMVGLHRVYGIFVAIPLFILWVHMVWMIILTGALLVRFQPRRRNPGRSRFFFPPRSPDPGPK